MSAPRRSIETALKLVAETYYGDEGAWLYQAFDAINKKLFFGELPYRGMATKSRKLGHHGVA